MARQASFEFAHQYMLPNSLIRRAKIPGEIGNQIGLAVKHHDREAVALFQFAQGRFGGIGRALDGGAHV